MCGCSLLKEVKKPHPIWGEEARNQGIGDMGLSSLFVGTRKWQRYHHKRVHERSLAGEGH